MKLFLSGTDFEGQTEVKIDLFGLMFQRYLRNVSKKCNISTRVILAGFPPGMA